MNVLYSLAVLLAYLVLFARTRVIGVLLSDAFCGLSTPFCSFGPETEARRTEVPPDSVLRLENPVLLPVHCGAEEASVSLGVFKEFVRLRGIANISSLESFLVSWVCFDGTLPASCNTLSVSVPSLSEASPKRARRSMDALVGLGADRLFVRPKAWATLEVLPSSF